MAKAKARRRQVRVIVRRAAHHAMTRDDHGLMSVVVGGIAGFIMNTEMVKQSEWLQKNWYAIPIALLLVGYALAKRKNPHGRTLMALGGYLFVNGFQNQPTTKPAEKKPGEAGSPWWGSPSGQWVVTPDGQQVFMPASQWQHQQDAGAPQLTQGNRTGYEGVHQTVNEIYGR